MVCVNSVHASVRIRKRESTFYSVINEQYRNNYLFLSFGLSNHFYVFKMFNLSFVLLPLISTAYEKGFVRDVSKHKNRGMKSNPQCPIKNDK